MTVWRWLWKQETAVKEQLKCSSLVKPPSAGRRGFLTLTQEGKIEVSLAWAEGQEWQGQEGPKEWSEAQSVEEPEHFRAWRRRGVLVRCAMLVT